MKSLLGLFKNPQIVMFAVAHWMIALYLTIEPLIKEIFGEKSPVSFSGSGYSYTWQSILFESLIIIDLPAIFSAALVCLPLKIISYDVFEKGLFLISIFTVTFQWLIIGKIVFNIFSKFESSMTKLSLKDG